MNNLELIADNARQIAILTIEIENRSAKINQLNLETVQAALRIGNAAQPEEERPVEGEA